MVVFDGGNGCSTAFPPKNPVPGWKCFKVKDGNLVICEPSSHDIGQTLSQL